MALSLSGSIRLSIWMPSTPFLPCARDRREMVPLVTQQGLSASELKTLGAGRTVLVWGIGDMALDVVTSMTKAGLRPQGLLHTAASAVGGSRYGLPIRAASEILAAAEQTEVFIVIATPAFRRLAEAECLQAGLRKDTDFISYFSVPRPHACVDVARDGESERIGCTGRTTGSHPISSQMTADIFSRVIDKLVTDLPLLCRLELALWGEPTQNPDLPLIVAMAQKVVPCTLATGLTTDFPMEALIKAQPNRFDITASGFGESYEARVPGASWSAFTRRIADLRACIAAHSPATRFQVRLYRQRDDVVGLEEQWRDLLDGSGIALSSQVPYVMPYDQTLNRCETGTWSPQAQRVADQLPWNLERTLKACMEERDRPCLSQRIFPVINPDLSVALCHLYRSPIIAPNYLSMSWTTLLDLRHQAAFCHRCQDFGLHRLDLDVLARRHPHVTSP